MLIMLRQMDESENASKYHRSTYQAMIAILQAFHLHIHVNVRPASL